MVFTICQVLFFGICARIWAGIIIILRLHGIIHPLGARGPISVSMRVILAPLGTELGAANFLAHFPVTADVAHWHVIHPDLL